MVKGKFEKTQHSKPDKKFNNNNNNNNNKYKPSWGKNIMKKNGNCHVCGTPCLCKNGDRNTSNHHNNINRNYNNNPSQTQPNLIDTNVIVAIVSKAVLWKVKRTV